MSDPNKPPITDQAPDFVSRYANVVRFESNVFDLKILFGDIDLSKDSEIHRLHTAVTVPWSLVKILAFFLQTNLILHEAENGKVTVPPRQIPKPPPDEPPSEVLDKPAALKALEAVRKFRSDFIEHL